MSVIVNVNVGIEKTLEVIGKGCGYFMPSLIRRKARAEAEARIIDQETAHRLQYREIAFAKNLESIAKKSGRHIDPDNSDSSKVDQDWATSFVENARLVSDEAMQELWARILAGEINKPGKYSIRTLNTLKSMGRNEAMVFKNFCSKLVVIKDGPITDTYGSHAERFVVEKISVKDRLILQELGLALFDEANDIFFSFKFSEQHTVKYQDKCINVSYCGAEQRDQVTKTIICGYRLTLMGSELFELIQKDFDENHWSNMKNNMTSIGFIITEFNC